MQVRDAGHGEECAFAFHLPSRPHAQHIQSKDEIAFRMPLMLMMVVSVEVMHDQRLLLPSSHSTDAATRRPDPWLFYVSVFDVSQKVPLTQVRPVTGLPATAENAPQSRLFDTKHSLLTLGTRVTHLFGAIKAQHVLAGNLHDAPDFADTRKRGGE